MAGLPFQSSQTPSGSKSNTGIAFTKKSYQDVYPFIDPTSAANSLSSYPAYTVLITGASRGLGRSTALAFARAGTRRIAVTSRSGCEDLVREIGGINAQIEVLDFKGDVSDEEAVKGWSETLGEKWGYVDAVINNAGVLHPRQRITDHDPKLWRATYDINVYGLFLTAHFFLPLLIAAPQGSPKTFLGVTSAGAHFTMDGMSAYQSSKLAVVRLCEHIGSEYAEQGITSYSAHPGGVVTATSLNMGEDFVKTSLNDTPELCGGVFVWLLKERRQWLQGRYLSVNMDLEEIEARKEEIVSGDLLKVRMAVEVGQ